MGLALDLQGISQWLAFVTIILFLTSEAVSHFGPAHGLVLDKALVRGVATICGAMLLIVIVILTYRALSP